MKKNNFILLLVAIACFAGKSYAQVEHPCYTDEMRKRMIALHPEILDAEASYKVQIDNALKQIDFKKFARTTSDETGNDTFWYDIPVVVHVIHDYNTSDYVTDNSIFNAVNDWNIVYAKQNADTAEVIAPYKGDIPNSHVRYIGNPHIRLHLANIDPNGNPTKGITRRRSYMTYNGGETAKFDDWAPTSYVNIWLINTMSAANGNAAAYAHLPPDVTYIPFWDGIICLSSYLDHGGASSPGSGDSYKTINHEMGHVMNLYHPWGVTNNPAVACGDDDVDDTPPTMGHNGGGCQYSAPSSNQNSAYDSACATNYFKIYTAASGLDSLVNYPDTTNTQNIMDYTYCAKMFTHGQVARMHAAMNSSVAGRNNLWNPFNLQSTGVWDTSDHVLPRKDLKPIPEFVAKKSGSGYMNTVNYFTFPGVNVTFINESWNDTVTATEWTFTGGAASPTVSSLASFNNSFTVPGWVDMTMKVTGNHTGDTTVEWKNAIFVADGTATSGDGYVQEWEPSGDFAKWPYFNYYNNEFHWQLDSTVGYDDHYCMKYVGYDSRVNTLTGQYALTGPPQGDFDDLFSVPVDLSSFNDTCNLNFYYSAASRSSSSLDVTDTMEIDYTTNQGSTWTKLKILGKSTLINKGAVADEYIPASASDWAPQTIGIPRAARTANTTFRFRYKPNVGAFTDFYGNPVSTGNDFYMDRINFSRIPAYVSMIKLTNMDVAVVPNPTDGDAYVVVKDANGGTVKIVVADITGKVVYTTDAQINSSEANVVIPRSVIAVPGMYLVTATTANQAQTKKLVVY